MFKYISANFVLLILVFFRFLIFSRFIDFSLDTSQEYSNFAFLNSLLPFCILGIPFGQNSIYPRLFKIDKNDKYVLFYKSFSFVFSLIILFISFFTKVFGVNSIYSYSLIQFNYNLLTNQKRNENIIYSILLAISEILYISYLLLLNYNDPVSNFGNLFKFYICISIFLTILLSKRFILPIFFRIKLYVFNIKNMILMSPMLLKDNIDIILLGLFADDNLKSLYAVIIISSSPSKILLSSFSGVLNKYFADFNLFYKDLFNKLNIRYILLIIFVSSTSSIFLINLFFNDIPLEIYFLTIVRSIGLIVGFKMRGAYLDNIQNDLEATKYKKILLISILIILFSLALFYSFSNIYLLCSLPLIISLIGLPLYKLNDGQYSKIDKIN